MHGFSCMRNVACVHVMFMVATVHTICECLHKNFLFCSKTRPWCELFVTFAVVFIWKRLSTIPKFGKSYRSNSKKTHRHVVGLTKGQTKIRKGRQNLFYGTLSATNWGPTRFSYEHIQYLQHLVNIAINTPAHCIIFQCLNLFWNY